MKNSQCEFKRNGLADTINIFIKTTPVSNFEKIHFAKLSQLGFFCTQQAANRGNKYIDRFFAIWDKAVDDNRAMPINTICKQSLLRLFKESYQSWLNPIYKLNSKYKFEMAEIESIIQSIPKAETYQDLVDFIYAKRSIAEQKSISKQSYYYQLLIFASARLDELVEIKKLDNGEKYFKK